MLKLFYSPYTLLSPFTKFILSYTPQKIQIDKSQNKIVLVKKSTFEKMRKKTVE
ncbi:hypothetical protein THA_420 [Thermosipho africanus TCF52B]|uniref:Uncharacterized protein n=1 Tax=Thermosipho africanus (strain TCF52B) TaxID=484019 RepID=B7IFP9_THEAB|nr:hypothetical protein THA_420 [Thermosipho africanus TCF52B]